MAKRKKATEPVATNVSEEEPKIVTSADINVNELFARLKEFENKALLDRLKILERSIALIQKAQTLDHTLLKEIKQHVSYLSLAHEEILNNIGYNESSYEDTETANEVVEKSDKKWN